MVDYREILRLKSLGYKNTDITASVHSSQNTIQEVVNLAGALKISWPLEDNVSNAALEELLYPGRKAKDENRLVPDYTGIHAFCGTRRTPQNAAEVGGSDLSDQVAQF